MDDDDDDDDNDRALRPRHAPAVQDHDHCIEPSTYRGVGGQL